MTQSADRQAEKQLIKARVRLDELARDLTGMEFRTRGPGDLWACCPFHNEDTPSFHVRPRLGLYKCFGCGASGDVFRFVQDLRGVGFRDALELLAERAGVQLGSLSPEDRRRQAEVRRIRDALQVAATLFARCREDPVAETSRRYLAGRGFAPQTLERFDVGYVPADFVAALRRAGLDSSDIERAGFTRQFGGRISFGIRDDRGALVGFGARTLAEGGPKYVNTRETEAFNKRRLLYGLDKAARAMARAGRIVVMEGYTDVMMAHQQGVDDAVASMGTSLTADHVRLLRGRARNLVFVFDGDRAGQDAAERAVRLALSQGLECRVVVLSQGIDPCDWFRSHVASDFEALLAGEGRSTVTFLCERILERLDPGQPGRAEMAAREVLELCRTVTDPVRREGIAAEIARACGVDRNLLVRAAPRSRQVESSAATTVLPAWVRSQLVAVGGLAAVPGARVELDELVRLGALTHPSATRLRELAALLDGDPIDPLEWLELVREREPGLAGCLEQLLFPPKDDVPLAYDEAVRHLRDRHLFEREKEARRAALSRPDIDADEAALRALDAGLRVRHTRPPSSGGPSFVWNDGPSTEYLTRNREQKDEL